MMQKQAHLALHLIAIQNAVVINCFRTIAEKQLRSRHRQTRLSLLLRIICRHVNYALLSTCDIQQAAGKHHQRCLHKLF